MDQVSGLVSRQRDEQRDTPQHIVFLLGDIACALPAATVQGVERLGDIASVPNTVPWVLGIVHSIGEGTDAGTTWFLVMTAIAVVPTVLLLGARWLTEEDRPAGRPAAAQ